jgi:hypothetical protein
MTETNQKTISPSALALPESGGRYGRDLLHGVHLVGRLQG